MGWKRWVDGWKRRVDGWACKVGFKMGRSTPRRLRLVMAEGSFFTADVGAAMDAEVWSRLPAELIWEVLRFVPAAVHFRLQSVSRKWRQVLTSAAFRNALPSRQSDDPEQRVVACVSRHPATFHVDVRSTSSSRLKVVDMDLSSMVPFWNPESSYSILAAADGLVCIANVVPGGETNCTQYCACVLNPLTRTYKVLPQVPFPWERCMWLPPTPTAVTVVGFMTDEGRMNGEVHVAKCDLAAGGDLKWDMAAYRSGKGWCRIRTNAPVVAVCGGETYWYRQYHGQVRVMAPLPGGSGRMVEVAALDEPVDSSEEPPDTSFDSWRVRLVVRGGAVFLVKSLNMFMEPAGGPVGLGVWRLARAGGAGRLQWEAVARLDVAELERLTGLECIFFGFVGPVCAARELLYCNVMVGSANLKMRSVELALNPDTGEWRLLPGEWWLLRDKFSFAGLLELRPDLYL